MSRQARVLLVLGIALVTAIASTSLPVAPALAHAPAATRARFAVQGSVEQVAVTGAPAGATALLVDRDGARVARHAVDRQGAALFRGVAPGSGYRVLVGAQRSDPMTVTRGDDVPAPSLYMGQHLGPGFGYITTRDGTRLSVDVSLPGPPDAGPYPTVVEYSGYDPSNPDGRQPASAVAQLLGYATVGVNLRGTGCSGGAFDYFEPLQSLDGYDVIETVAAQSWVANGAVGMVGISYPGITQLFVAATRPPHLAAITPLSVIDDTYDVLYPGGILNDGFAVDWARERAAAAQPASSQWVQRRIASGDATCKANQALRLQSRDVEQQIAALRRGRVPAMDALAPATFVHKIDVPVFLAGAWQDEETGGHFAEMLDDFAPGVPLKVTLFNGLHADSLGPEVLARWAEFLDFYVAHRVPSIPASTRVLANALFAGSYGPGVTLPPDRFDPATSYGAARSAYEAEPPVRVLFESGAGGPAGAPVAAFETTLSSWPPPREDARTWYFEPSAALGADPPAGRHTDRFVYDPSSVPRTLASSGEAATLFGTPTYDWKQLPKGKAVAYTSDPLTADTVMLGTGSVDVWVRTRVADVDLEATISEVRPDGKETYVQSGWLRASHRALDESASTALDPVPSYRPADTRPLPRGKFTLLRIPLFPFGHVFRAGSEVRITIQPPGGNRTKWAFAARTYGDPVNVDVALDHTHASRAVLPVVTGIAVPTPLPACDSLRGQPCRDAVRAVNSAMAPGRGHASSR